LQHSRDFNQAWIRTSVQQLRVHRLSGCKHDSRAFSQVQTHCVKVLSECRITSRAAIKSPATRSPAVLIP
jgi:hypothetical protein